MNAVLWFSRYKESIFYENTFTKCHKNKYVFYLQSGTVGYPKAVMLSHDNLIYNVRSMNRIFKFKTACEHIVSYLPLSHVAAQVNYLNFLFEIFKIIYYIIQAIPHNVKG